MRPDTPDRLRAILDYKADEVRELKRRTSLRDLESAAADAGPTRGFATRMLSIAGDDGNGLICEVKRKSPSAGNINLDRSPEEAASAYEAGGAACISVLTDGPSFGGCAEDLISVRTTVSLPVIRKDFMIDPIQVAEARAMGADAILIIMAAVDDTLAAELHAAADDFSMSVLVESHDAVELERALKLPSPLMGVNNRDLRIFETNLETTEALSAMIPKDRILISESGIRDPADIVRLRKCGARGFLIGESLMRSQEPDKLLQQMRSAGT